MFYLVPLKFLIARFCNHQPHLILLTWMIISQNSSKDSRNWRVSGWLILKISSSHLVAFNNPLFNGESDRVAFIDPESSNTKTILNIFNN
ncbi:hypothetical protein BpHYR1_000753 [Brachionus plicatilis]|uniref:Uncharacterized protein n=1 Tax=Brachionus plicatilis TaxID=10195 RepID=A0A3M7S315_BRAPC|nr:hypothetical protein BpHYR1_000753 [Brachionus plicatilis]